jgi:MurNAc alpha-1-phosphate uridylyltransferase
VDVLILAAGRGERMRPLTDNTPKPLLEAGGTTLIERQIRRLVSAGHRRLVVNLAHLGEQIQARLGDGSRYGARIVYSPEPPGALDTGGGIIRALQHLHGDCFAVVNADIWTDFPYEELPEPPGCDAWLVLVDNPPHHPEGDFVLEDGTLRSRQSDPGPALTFTGIGVYRRRLFEGRADGSRPLLPVLLEAMDRGEARGTHYRGMWNDIGTPERLEALREELAANG